MKAIGSFFKNFVVYNHDMDIDRDVMQHEVPALTDPNGQTWSTVGLVPVTDEGFIFHSLDGMGLLFCVQFNERILPAKVRDEHFRKTLDAIEQREGRKPTKKEYAELRDEAERDLLPKAFIKRAKVFGLLTNSRLLIFTGSSKRQDDVLLIINHYLNDVGIDNTSIRRPSLKEAVSGMTSLALEEDDWLSATDHGVLRIEGEVKPTIRVKDKDIYSADVQTLLKQGYRVNELGLRSLNVDAEFTLNKSMTVKRFNVGGDLILSHGDTTADFHGAAWLVCRTALDVWKEIESSFEDDEL